MTAIKDALNKAGLDTALAQLKVLAAKALEVHQTPKKASRYFWRTIKKQDDLGEAMSLDFLNRFVAEEKSGAGHPANDAQATPAGAATDPIKKIRIQDYNVPSHQRRPPGAKAAAREAAQAGAVAILDAYNAREIDGRPIGDLNWHELGRMVSENAMNAASYLRLGTEATETALLLFKIASWATVSDQSMRIRDVIKAEQLVKFIDEAHHEAPSVVERGMREYAAAIEHRKLEIAHATN